MKSETRTRHHRSSGYACIHVSYRLHHLQNICLTFELVHLNAHISLFIDIFVIFVIHRYTRRFMFKFTEAETVESASSLLSLFYKSTFCCYCECTQINVESLQIWKMFKSYLHKWGSIWRNREHRTDTLHRHFNSTHFSGLTFDWAAL